MMTVSQGFYGDCVTGISKIYSDLSYKFPDILSGCNQILISLMDFNESAHNKIS